MNDDFDEILRIQRMLDDSTRRELQDDRQTELMALVNSVVPYDKKVQLEEIFYAALDKGFTENEIRKVINQYIKDKIFFQPEAGYIQRR
ncbi:MAG: hypothetical protein ACLFTR_01600 [Candidatus Woesearchaeota archaeon]